MCTKHVFATFGSPSYTVNAIHSVIYALIKLSLAYPTHAQHSTVLLLAFHYMTENLCDQKFGSILHFVWIKIKCNFATKCPILLIKFPGMIPPYTHCRIGWLTLTLLPQHGRSSLPQFDPPPHFQIPSAVYVLVASIHLTHAPLVEHCADNF